jgi:DNA polymerase-3 subunit delta
MNEHSVLSFKKYIEKPISDNLFVIHGEERFFFDQILEDIEKSVFTNKADKDLNYHLFYGTEITLSELLNTCLSYPMLTDRKLVIVKEFDKLQITDPESFLKYLDNPQSTTILVLVADRFNRTKIYTDILKKGVTVKCRKLNESDIFHWTMSKLKEFNIQADRESVAFLVENIGANLLRLNLEIEKIKSFLETGQPLTLDLVSQITGFEREVNIYNFQNVLAARNLKSSLKIGSHLLEQGEALAAMLPSVFTFFRRIWVVKELVQKNYSQKQILEMLHGHPFAYREIFSNVNKFEREHLDLIFSKLLEAEIQLKTSQKSSESILTILCYYICNYQKN